MIIVSSEIFKYFDFIKDINIRVLSQSADIASFLIQFSKLVGARKSGNGEIFLYATKRRYLEAGEFQFHAELASSSHEDLSISFESPDEG